MKISAQFGLWKSKEERKKLQSQKYNSFSLRVFIFVHTISLSNPKFLFTKLCVTSAVAVDTESKANSAHSAERKTHSTAHYLKYSEYCPVDQN